MHITQLLSAVVMTEPSQLPCWENLHHRNWYAAYTRAFVVCFWGTTESWVVSSL